MKVDFTIDEAGIATYITFVIYGLTFIVFIIILKTVLLGWC